MEGMSVVQRVANLGLDDNDGGEQAGWSLYYGIEQQMRISR